jgi:hypothetical protein
MRTIKLIHVHRLDALFCLERHGWQTAYSVGGRVSRIWELRRAGRRLLVEVIP